MPAWEFVLLIQYLHMLSLQESTTLEKGFLITTLAVWTGTKMFDVLNPLWQQYTQTRADLVLLKRVNTVLETEISNLRTAQTVFETVVQASRVEQE